MRKIFFLYIVCLSVLSCSFPHYIIENSAQTTGLDFTQGKWLINDIDCPGNVYKELTDMSSKDFGNYLQQRLYPVYNVKGIILPQKIDFNPSKTTLKEMKKGCVGFDYFINIRAGKLKEDIGGFDLAPHRTINKSRSNESEVLIEVYDLNLLEIIYSQKVIGTTTISNDNQDVHFSKTSRSLILGAYNKIIQDIDKKSIKK
jgi:hypothetical protein